MFRRFLPNDAKNTQSDKCSNPNNKLDNERPSQEIVRKITPALSRLTLSTGRHTTRRTYPTFEHERLALKLERRDHKVHWMLLVAKPFVHCVQIQMFIGHAIHSAHEWLIFSFRIGYLDRFQFQLDDAPKASTDELGNTNERPNIRPKVDGKCRHLRAGLREMIRWDEAEHPNESKAHIVGKNSPVKCIASIQAFRSERNSIAHNESRPRRM